MPDQPPQPRRPAARRAPAGWPLAAAALLLAAPAAAAANSRLPIRYELPPSSAVFSPGRDLVVEHETLRFECGDRGCDVTATYLVRAAQAVTVGIRFLGHSPEVLEARSGDEVRPVRVTPLAEDLGPAPPSSHDRLRVGARELELDGESGPRDCAERPRLDEPADLERYVRCQLAGNWPRVGEGGVPERWRLFELSFDAPLLTGPNLVTVRYHQPWSQEELEVGTFPFSPVVAEVIGYELWPLQEWQLDRDFSIDLEVRLQNPRHGLFWRLRRDLLVRGASLGVASAAHFRSQGVSALEPDVTAAQDGATLVLRGRLGKAFPDRLLLYAGEADDLRSLRGGAPR